MSVVVAIVIHTLFHKTASIKKNDNRKGKKEKGQEKKTINETN